MNTLTEITAHGVKIAIAVDTSQAFVGTQIVFAYYDGTKWMSRSGVVVDEVQINAAGGVTGYAKSIVDDLQTAMDNFWREWVANGGVLNGNTPQPVSVIDQVIAEVRAHLVLSETPTGSSVAYK